jgi:uncharacterized membrane protein
VRRETVTRRSDERVERVMGAVLRSGVIVAAAVVLLGGVLYLVAHGGLAVPRYAVFRGEPSDLRTISGVIRDAGALRATGIIQLGLLLLIATPVARVALALVAFALQRDVTYVVVAVVVLSVLAYSLTSGGL